jgi:hypothetical protein
MSRRLGAILEISRSKNLAFRRRFLGQVLPAITLAREEELGESIVLTGNYIHVRVSDLSIPPNRLVSVCIEDVQPSATRGRAFELNSNCPGSGCANESKTACFGSGGD